MSDLGGVEAGRAVADGAECGGAVSGVGASGGVASGGAASGAGVSAAGAPGVAPLALPGLTGKTIVVTGADGSLVRDSERNIARQRRDIGMVFQRFNLFPHMALVTLCKSRTSPM